MICPGPGNRRKKLLAAVFILFSAAVLFGRGAREDSVLSRADDLIAEKQYDEAMMLLSDYMRDNPDNFGEAQKRLNRIVQIRERYNQIAHELLDMLESDPENDDRILELSDLLMTIESPSNPATAHFLNQIRYLAELSVNRRRLERILLAARQQLEQNDFSGALATYASGLDIYQDAFFSAGYGQEAEYAATRGLEVIDRSIEDFNNLAGPYADEARALAGFIGPSRPDPAELETVFLSMASRMYELVNLEGDLYDIRRSYDELNEMLQDSFDVSGDRTFPAFAGRLITGPAGQNEGMTGAIGRFRVLHIEPAETALNSLVYDSYRSVYSTMANRNYQDGLSFLGNVSAYINVAIEMLKLNAGIAHQHDSVVYSIYEETLNEEKAWEYLRLSAMRRVMELLAGIGILGMRSEGLVDDDSGILLSWRQGLLDARTAITREENIRRSYRELTNELGAIDKRMSEESAMIREYEEILADAPRSIGAPPQSYLGETRILWNDLFYRLDAREYNSVVRMYTIATTEQEKRVLELERTFERGHALILGVPRELGTDESFGGTGTYTAYYPAEGLELLAGINLAPEIDSARALLSRYSEEPREMLERAELNVLHLSAQDLLDRLLGLQNRNEGIVAQAGTRIDRANALRSEGDRLFQEAQSALSRGNYDLARENVERVKDRYMASLELQESPALRAAWESRLIPLGAEIVRAENEVVVRDVRNLLNSARTSYYAGNLDYAEETLVRAQNRWRVTNVTEHTEVEYWMGLVRGALSLQSGRTIAPTAPLYAEMSQLLSDAKRNYDEGVRLLNLGRRQDGLARFREAMEKTREVRLVFNMNHEARMLELRIEQQTDQNAFNAAFRQRLAEAQNGIRNRSVESFALLQVLAEMNPNYPGIRAMLTQAEIDMGFRPPPPDPRDLARSAELSRSAQAIVSSRDSIRYEAARAWLDESIKLDPNNNQAQSLMDQLQILMTGSGTIVLSPYAQERYNMALQEFLRGNYLSANAIVQQLLQNPESRRSTLIQDLKRRIDAVLL